MLKPLAAYALSFILSTSPAKLHRDETALAYAMRAIDIATDVAEVVSDEPPIFEGDGHYTKTISLLLSVAFWESNFQRYVDIGLCDDHAWRETTAGHAAVIAHADCDLMQAFSLWQIHPEEGVVLTEAGWTRAGNKSQAWLSTHTDEVLNGSDLILDRRVAARVALHMMRPGKAHLRNYTGETAGWAKADARYNMAMDWAAKHPSLP